MYTKRLTGGTWGAAVQVDSDAVVAGNIEGAHMAMKKDGSQYLFVYEKAVAELNYSYYTPATDTWVRSAARLDSVANPIATTTQMYVSYGSDGRAICVYNGTGANVIAASLWDGTSSWDETGTGAVSATAGANSPIFTFDAGNNGMCCYIDTVGTAIKGVYYDGSQAWGVGDWIATGNDVAGTVGTRLGLAVDNNATGNFIAVYANGGAVFENFYSGGAAGDFEAAPTEYDGGAGGYPGVAFDSANIAYLIYSNGVNGTHVRRRTAGAAGALEAAVQRIDDATVFNNTNTAITFDPNGAYGIAGYLKTDAGGTWNFAVKKYVVSTATWDTTPTTLLSAAAASPIAIMLAGGVSSNAEAGWITSGNLFYVKNYR